MVTAAGAPWTPADLRDDEIVVSQWLAEDLRVKPGDEIALSYFLPESGAKLTEATNTFRVRSVVPMEMPWADRTLMPDFPGIEKAESTSEWDAGFPLTYKVRPQGRRILEATSRHAQGVHHARRRAEDVGQSVWQSDGDPVSDSDECQPPPSPRPSPPGRGRIVRRRLDKSKTGRSARRLQKNREASNSCPLSPGERVGSEGDAATNWWRALGSHWSERGVAPVKSDSYVVSYKEALEKKILANLKPEELGLRFEPVREQALKAAEESQDFGGLFLGFSFFLIAAALLLMALLFQLGLEQRAPEIGTLLALGFTPKQVRRLLLGEGVALSFIGGVLGALGGLAYARAMLHGLTTIWRDAVGASALSFHFTAPNVGHRFVRERGG